MKTRLIGWMALSVLGAALFTGCESDFVTDPTRPRPTRALEDPFARGSANSEVMGGPTGAVPLVTVEMPRTKEEPPVVRTIAGELASASRSPTSRPAGAVTRPATQPDREVAAATVAPAAESRSDQIKVVAQQRPADVITITRDNEANADVWVLCPSGIGTVTLERLGENWPAIIRVHLRYDAGRGFTTLEGFNAYEVTAPDRRLSLKATTDKAMGKAEIVVPGFARSQQILIEWVDAYR